MRKYVIIGFGIAVPVIFLPSAWALVCRRIADWTIANGWLDVQLADALGRGFAVLPILAAYVGFIAWLALNPDAIRKLTK